MRLRFLLALTALVGAAALKEDLKISHDDRELFVISVFGFETGGEATIRVSNFKIYSEDAGITAAGLMLLKTERESDLQDLQQELTDNCEGMLTDPSDGNLALSLPLTGVGNGKLSLNVANEDMEGLYHLVFSVCAEDGPTDVSFRMVSDFHNPGPNYLSLGKSCLPTLYLCFCGVFALALVVWIKNVRQNIEKAHHVHHLMSILLLIKVLLLLVEAIRWHYLKVDGSAHAWEIIYYILAFLKGVLLFIVILLIGAGWSILKGHLSDREKKIIFVVLILQVLDNIALIVVDESSRGTQARYTWSDILHLVDIICACLILLPVVWSIRHLETHLREVSPEDGKAVVNLRKLKVFRQLYLTLVTYIYFTRVAVLLFGNFFEFHYMWLEEFMYEAATLMFFTFTGYKFRPAAENPYLPVKTEDDLEEFGLVGDGDEERSGADVRVAL